MIYAIGHDIVDNKRIARMLEQYGQKVVQKILSVSEQQSYTQRHDKANFVAKRFAAKEAFAKACGTGLRDPILMSRISVINDKLGKPVFEFATEIKLWLETRRINRCHISLSDETSISSAFVVLEQGPK